MSAHADQLLHQIVESLPEVLWVRRSGTGAMLYCSSGAERLWGRASGELLATPGLWSGSVHVEDLLRVKKAWEQTSQGAPLEVDYRVMLPDGTVRWISDHGSQLPGKTGQLAGLSRDVTERKALESELRRARDALHASVNGVMITDLEGKINYANPAFLQLFGFPDLSAAIGRRPERLFVSDEIEAPADVTNEISGSGNRTREFVVRREDGSELLMEVSSSNVHDGQGAITGTVASFVDVTERKLRENEARAQHLQLIRLTERMADLEERERRRISALIHDSVVQSLSLANIRLGPVRKILTEKASEEEVSHLDASRELIADGIRRCRLVMGDLTPPLLYEVGLGAALRQFADRLQQLQGIQITVDEAGAETPVPESLRGILFQAARELVMNACKHAAPSSITIALSGYDDCIELSVRDDGCGFDAAVVEQPKEESGGGFGLLSIRQRLAGQGGTLAVDSTVGAGTAIQVVLPTRPGPAKTSPVN